jgi:hypothetical protein
MLNVTAMKLNQCKVWVVAATMIFVVLARPSFSQEPPRNPALADSGWPIFHRNNYAQASGMMDAIGSNDRVRIELVPNERGGVSSWTVLLPAYADGTQAAIGSNRLGVVKSLLKPNQLERVSFLPIPRNALGFDFNLAVLRDGSILTTSRKENAFYRLADRQPNCPQCELVVVQKIPIPAAMGQITVHFSVAFDGTLISLMEDSRLIAVSLTSGKVLATLNIPVASGDVSYHNAFPIDETGRIYLASQSGMSAIDWRNGELNVAWHAPYDFRGPGCEKVKERPKWREVLAVATGQRCTGTGTTPTLLGNPQSGVVAVVDGHAPNNRLVAFWRDAIPLTAQPAEQQHPRVASILTLPLSTLLNGGFTAENSPAAWGNSIFIAQWLGFRPKCSGPRGVQRVDWLSQENRLALIWANRDAHFNGVPTVSMKTGLVYGSGYGDGCDYRYRGLDIQSGQIKLDIPLGSFDSFLDQGNQQTIAADGSLLYAATGGLVRLKREK